MLLESPSRPSSWLRRQYRAVFFRFDSVSCPPVGQTVQSIVIPQYPERFELSSTLRAQLSLLEVQFCHGFQLVLHGFAAMPGKHGEDSNLPPAGCLHPLHGDMMIVDGDIGFLLHRLPFFDCLLSLPTRRLRRPLPRGRAGTLPIAEERRTGRHGANGRVFTARPCGSDHGVRLCGRPVRECVPAGNGFCPPPPGPVPLRGDSAKSGGYWSRSC